MPPKTRRGAGRNPRLSPDRWHGEYSPPYTQQRGWAGQRQHSHRSPRRVVPSPGRASIGGRSSPGRLSPVRYRPPAEVGVMVPATRIRLTDELFGYTGPTQTSPRREPEGPAFSSLDGLEQKMIDDGLLYEERRRLWNRGVTRIEIYRALRDDDFAAEGIARRERREAYEALLAVERHTSISETIHKDFQEEFEQYRFRHKDGSPVHEGDVDDLETSLHKPVGGYSSIEWGSGGFAAAGATLDRVRLRKAELQADEHEKSRRADEFTERLKREFEEREEHKRDVAALLARGVNGQRALLNGGMLSPDGKQVVLRAVTSPAQLMAMDLHDMRLLGLSVLDCRILDEIRIEALRNPRYEDAAPHRTRATRIRSPRSPGNAHSPGHGWEPQSDRDDHTTRWAELMSCVRENGWDTRLPPHLNWSRENEEWLADWIQAKDRKARVRKHHSDWVQTSPRSVELPRSAAEYSASPSSGPSGTVSTAGQPDAPHRDVMATDWGASPTPSAVPPDRPPLVPNERLDSSSNSTASQADAPYVDHSGGTPTSSGLIVVSRAPAAVPSGGSERSIERRSSTMSQPGKYAQLIEDWKDRVQQAMTSSEHVREQRLERCGGAMFGGCSSCRMEGFHLKQGLSQTTKWMGGSVMRQKGMCFRCGAETLRCTTENCGAFSETSELKCMVCTGAITGWERESADDESFDFRRAERLVENDVASPATRSHHLKIDLLEFVTVHGDRGKSHIEWILEIRIGNEEPYRIQRRFNLFKTLLANLKVWDFKPEEVQNRVKRFTKAVPTASWVQSYTDDTNLKLRLERLAPWCNELAAWASKLMDPKTGDAFVDYLRVCRSDGEKQLMEQKLQMQEGLKPIREFFLPDDFHSASYSAEMMKATIKLNAGTPGVPRSASPHNGTLPNIAEDQEEVHTHLDPEPETEPEPEPEPVREHLAA